MDLIGKTLLGKYRIEGLLGQGGMGSVWKGSHAITGRKVAIKVLDDRFLSNVNVVQRFGREARAASSIHHEGIVEVLDLDQTEDGIPFLVMEFLDGETLSSRIERRGRLPQDEVVRFAELLLDALEAAHEHGVVHRDLKPDNIILKPAGRRGEIVKILDFGISHKDDEAHSKLTVTGSVLGTPHYMSPEQAMGETDLDRRVDIYAAGVVLYECLVGEVPFDAPNYNKLLRIILDEEPVPPSRRGAVIDPRLEAVVLSAIAKDRERRPQTARDFLGQIHASLRPAPRPAKSSASFPRPAGVRASASTDALAVPVLPPLEDAAPARRSSSGAIPALALDEPLPVATPAPTKPASSISSGSRPRPALEAALRSGGGLDVLGDLGAGAAAPSALEIDEDALAQRSSRTSVPRMRAISGTDIPVTRSTPGSLPPAPATRSTPPRSTPARVTPARGIAAQPEEPAEAPPPPKPPLVPEHLQRPLLLAGLGLLVFVIVVVSIRYVVQPGTVTEGVEVGAGAGSGVGTARETAPTTSPGSEWVYIEVDGVPPRARLRLDGLPGATLPLRVRRGGRHVLEIRADGYEDRRIEFEALAGTRLQANMRPAVGSGSTL